mmetsp:Transcript_291/g.721  ORF Transcript_291/g.721 Transcript_291/m.721 type:complete len:304 (+) Transcript_291:1141-2052(+)
MGGRWPRGDAARLEPPTAAPELDLADSGLERGELPSPAARPLLDALRTGACASSEAAPPAMRTSRPAESRSHMGTSWPDAVTEPRARSALPNSSCSTPAGMAAAMGPEGAAGMTAGLRMGCAAAGRGVGSMPIEPATAPVARATAPAPGPMPRRAAAATAALACCSSWVYDTCVWILVPLSPGPTARNSWARARLRAATTANSAMATRPPPPRPTARPTASLPLSLRPLSPLPPSPPAWLGGASSVEHCRPVMSIGSTTTEVVRPWHWVLVLAPRVGCVMASCVATADWPRQGSPRAVPSLAL